MASAYEKAVAEKARLKSEKARIDSRIAELDTFLRILEELSEETYETRSSRESTTEPQDIAESSADGQDVESSERIRGVTQKEFNEHLRETLIEYGTPLSTRQVRRIFDEKNIPIGGEYPDRNFSSKIWQATKDGGFVRIPTNNLIWFIDVSYPDAGYIAPQFRTSPPARSSRSADDEEL